MSASPRRDAPALRSEAGARNRVEAAFVGRAVETPALIDKQLYHVS